MIELWTFILQSNNPGSIAQKSAWIDDHKCTCNILRYVINRNAFDKIK